MVDYLKPNGEKVKRTIADYRQLNDALFHAGLNSGSFFEWEDTANRLHFYIIDLRKDEQGILSYTLAVRSLDGSGPQVRGAALDAPGDLSNSSPNTPLTFSLHNTGTTAETDPELHPSEAEAYLRSDIYRLSLEIEGEGWTAQLLNGLAAVEFGGSRAVKVYVSRSEAGAPAAVVTLKAQSESDPSQVASASVRVSH
jgi:hypothetical protein